MAGTRSGRGRGRGLGRGGTDELASSSTGPITRSAKRKPAKKVTRVRKPRLGIFNLVKWGPYEFYTTQTQEEYIACKKAEEERCRKPASPEVLVHQKRQSDDICRHCFKTIQEKRPEMVDYEFVEPMGTRVIMEWGCRVHVNFIAKNKHDIESSQKLFLRKSIHPQQRVMSLFLLS